MDPTIEALAGSIRSILKGRLDKFLSERADEKEFLEERTRRLAELTVLLGKAVSNQVERARIIASMEVVSDTIVNELNAAAVDISAEFRASVRDILGTVLEYTQKVLPKVLVALTA